MQVKRDEAERNKKMENEQQNNKELKKLMNIRVQTNEPKKNKMRNEDIQGSNGAQCNCNNERTKQRSQKGKE